MTQLINQVTQDDAASRVDDDAPPRTALLTITPNADAATRVRCDDFNDCKP